jgi:hypothetical protein
MPVILPPITIRPPCTLSDNGAPSDSLANDVDRVFFLIDDERHLTAHTLLTSVQQRIAAWEENRHHDHDHSQQQQQNITTNNSKSTTTTSPVKKPKKLSKKKQKLAVDENERKEVAEMQRLKDFLNSKHAAIHKLEVRVTPT